MTLFHCFRQEKLTSRFLQGILTTARETHTSYANPLLTLAYRKRRMARELDRMRENLAEEKLMYEQEAARMTTNTDLSQEAIADFVRERLELNQREERRAESAIRSR